MRAASRAWCVANFGFGPNVTPRVRRRQFITLVGGATTMWPLWGRAQQSAIPVIGFLNARSPDDTAHLVEAFRHGLSENGVIEGRTVNIEYRWGFGQYDRLPALAAELVRRPVDLLVATGGEPTALAAKSATSTIPIVFAIGSDPVKLGLAASYNRPDGNATGISGLTATLEPKRIGLLHELAPTATIIGFLVNPNFPATEAQSRDAQEAARAVGRQLRILRADTDGEIDAAFAAAAKERIAALAVAASPSSTRAGKSLWL
jgi:putative ABC transport system substrate-binding protein